MLSSSDLEAKAKATRHKWLSTCEVIVLEVARSDNNIKRGGFSLFVQAIRPTHSAPGQTRA